MTTITIPIEEERLERLVEIASVRGIAPEDLAREGIEKILERPDERPDFEKLLDETMEKYDDLYRRLA